MVMLITVVTTKQRIVNEEVLLHIVWSLGNLSIGGVSSIVDGDLFTLLLLS